MKNTVLVLLALILFTNIILTSAEKPEKVYSIVKQVKPFEWYAKQAELWKKAIDKEPNTPEAWLYFYTANRMARIVGFKEWKESKSGYFMELDTIVSSMKKAIPNTFEFYYIQGYNNGSWDDDDIGMIEKAYEKDPSRPETYDDLIGFAEVFGDKVRMKEICKKMLEANEIAEGIYIWNYNVLMSLDKNAVVITNGDNDTYPVWVLQQAKNIRPDVKLLNISLLSMDKYRDKIFKELDIKPFTLDTAKLKGDGDVFISMGGQIINHIVENLSKRPVYFSLTLNPEFYARLKQDIYMVGLAFKYSKEKFDNIALLRKNYENNFLLDYLKESFINDISKTVTDQLNMNYIPLFLKLYEHYSMSGETPKSEKIKGLIMHIAAENGRESEVKGWFESTEN